MVGYRRLLVTSDDWQSDNDDCSRLCFGVQWGNAQKIGLTNIGEPRQRYYHALASRWHREIFRQMGILNASTPRYATRTSIIVYSVIFSPRRPLSLSLEAAQPSMTDPSLDVAWAANGRTDGRSRRDGRLYRRRLLIQSPACFGRQLNGASRTCSGSGHVILNAMQSKHNAPTHRCCLQQLGLIIEHKICQFLSLSR